MTNEEVDLIIELFKCGKCEPIIEIDDDKGKRYFMICDKHQEIANSLDYFKKINTH